ncbi:hypothetical protein [Sphingomicrobium nitratireducens]|uniref:hypothetical protein n=1 Tax=Sphingomicrobium nitratireducens TaxID=2964666 RepID=UPI00223F163A|nr:hypothetical protein [Sphingomicrobium nitratireducens]
MKTSLRFAIVAAGSLAIAACGGQGDDAAADAVEDAYENEADSLEAQADAAMNEAAEEALEAQADALEEAGEKKADEIDAADIHADGGETEDVVGL